MRFRDRSLLALGGMAMLAAAWKGLEDQGIGPENFVQGGISLDAVPLICPLLFGGGVSCFLIGLWGELNRVGTWASIGLAFGAVTVSSWHMVTGYPWWVFAFSLITACTLILALLTKLAEILSN